MSAMFEKFFTRFSGNVHILPSQVNVGQKTTFHKLQWREREECTS